MASSQSVFPISIRSATVQDIPTIQSLAAAIWPVTYGHILSPQQMAYMMDIMYSAKALEQQIASGHQFLLVEEEGKAVAFAAFNETAPAVVKLQKLYVLPTQQGKGTGRLLIDYVLEEARRFGAATLQLNVNRHNKARDFYERLGFEVIKGEKIAIGNGYVMDDYIMERPIVTRP